MNDRVRSHKVYAAWEYEKEESDLNEASQKGLQLIRGGSFSSDFRRDNSVRYVYQMDYNTEITDPQRYRAAFEEQGWEYINSTFNGWHYFRKPYQEGVEPSEYRIYTDKQSLHQMQNRWVRLIGILFAVYVVMLVLYLIHAIRSLEPSFFMQSAVFALLSVTLGLGLLSTVRSRKGKKTSVRLPIHIAMLIGLIILVAAVVVAFFGHPQVIQHQNFNFINMEQNTLPVASDSYSVARSGNYRLDLEMEAPGGEMTVTIVSDDGEVVYELTTDRSDFSGQRVYLKKGQYKTLYTYNYDQYDPANAQVRVDFLLKR